MEKRQQELDDKRRRDKYRIAREWRQPVRCSGWAQKRLEARDEDTVHEKAKQRKVALELQKVHQLFMQLDEDGSVRHSSRDRSRSLANVVAISLTACYHRGLGLAFCDCRWELSTVILTTGVHTVATILKKLVGCTGPGRVC